MLVIKRFERANVDPYPMPILIFVQAIGLKVIRNGFNKVKIINLILMIQFISVAVCGSLIGRMLIIRDIEKVKYYQKQMLVLAYWP